MARSAEQAVSMQKVLLTGFIAWMMWLFLHVFFLIGFRNRVIVMLDWFWAYLTRERSARLITGDADELRDAIMFLQGENAVKILDDLDPKKRSADKTAL